MKLNAFSDYTLRTLIYLALVEGTNVTAQEVASRFDLSFHHIAKVAQWLARNGYVKASRGRGGGMTLIVPPEEISIGTVMRATERGTAIIECMKPGASSCKITPACLLAPAINEAQEAFFATLDQKTLADIISNKTHLKRVLNVA